MADAQNSGSNSTKPDEKKSNSEATKTAPDTSNKADNKKSGSDGNKSGQGSEVAQTAQDAGKAATPASGGLLDQPGSIGMTKKEAEDTAGSLKVHVKLALEVDIRITARIKGDIAIGIL